jgi:hypothetical protein
MSKISLKSKILTGCPLGLPISLTLLEATLRLAGWVYLRTAESSSCPFSDIGKRIQNPLLE